METKNTRIPTGRIPRKAVDYEGLQASLENAVRTRIPKDETIGIAFSAGVDSGLIAHVARQHTEKIELLVVGTLGSADFARAEGMAKKWGMKLVKKEVDEKEIRAKYALAGKILKTKDHLQCTIGAVNLAVGELAKERNIRTVFVGSGADELFCGYAVFDGCRNDPIKCDKIRAEKVANVGEHDVKREKKCGAQYGVELQAPYLDADFTARAMAIPGIENLLGKYGELRKGVLRRLAERMGVPEEIVAAPKKAMQYGSGMAKITEKFTNR